MVGVVGVVGVAWVRIGGGVGSVGEVWWVGRTCACAFVLVVAAVLVPSLGCVWVVYGRGGVGGIARGGVLHSWCVASRRVGLT